MNGNQFPHGCLVPEDVIPRIQPSSAAKICKLVADARDKGIGRLEFAAIAVAVFDGPMVKWILDEQRAKETIKRLKSAIAKAGEAAKEE
jgi:hypothetical protein